MRIQYFIAKSLWIYYLSREWTKNSLSTSRFLFEFNICFVNSLSVWRTNLRYPFHFAKSLWIHYLLGDFIMNTLSVSRIFYEFTNCFAISFWIHFLYRKFTFFAKPLCYHYLFRNFTFESLSYYQNHYEYTFFAISLLIRYEITIE